MNSIIVNLLNGLSFGMILFFVSAGLSIVLGLMGILNLAHGALYLIGGYVGYEVATSTGGGFWAGLACAGAVAGVLGLVMDRLLLQRIRMSLDSQILATLGLTYVIQNVITWIWSAQSKAPIIAPGFGGSIELGEIRFPTMRLELLVIGAAVAAGLWYLQDRTSLGATLRAGMEDPAMVGALGRNLGRISTLVFVGASVLVGFSGMLGQQLLGLSPPLAMNVLLLSLVVLVIGGAGSIQGALLGSLVVGVADSFGSAILPDFSSFLTYALMILVLAVKPAGLIGSPAMVRR